MTHRFLHPGQWAVETERTIKTVLGSCVTVCFYDPQLGVAGMNHFLLPKMDPKRYTAHDVVLSGDAAMEVLLNAMLKEGAQKKRLVAKAFGGGNIVNSPQWDVGQRNAEFALQWLSREAIPLIASDLGGAYSRTLIFHPLTGDAFCRRTDIKKANLAAIAEKEKAYALSLQLPAQEVKKKIEFF